MNHWHTRINGNPYRLTETGRLEREETPWQQHDYPVAMIHRSGKRSFNESSAPNSTHSPND